MLRQEFIRLCREKYGDAFEYPSLPESVKRNVITVICKRHGKFEVIARDHLRTKHGCPRCAAEYKQVPVSVSNQNRLDCAKRKFADKYDYSKVDLNTTRKGKVEIICPIHGSFATTLRTHLHGKCGCPQCGRDDRAASVVRYRDLHDVTEASRKIHGDKYTYLSYCFESKVVVLECSIHGVLEKELSSHLAGRGCRSCGYENRTITPEDFSSRVSLIHPSGYSFHLSELKSVNDRITVTHECGKVYKARVSNILSGQGCYDCRRSSLGEDRIREFLRRNEIEYRDQFAIDGSTFRYDFYLPTLNILIEYDGEQHFRPVAYFGGEDAFLKRQKRDEEKNILAAFHGFVLIRISYKYKDDLEVYLSRAIDRYFKYRVDGVFYRNAVALCESLGLSDKTSIKDLKRYKTSNVLKPAQSEMIE